MNSMSSRQKMILSFVAGLIVGSGGAWLRLERGWSALVASPSQEEQASPEGEGVADISGTAADGVAAAGGESVEAADQPAGQKVVVTNVALPQGGWVVVHEEQNGAPSLVLGAQRFPSGTTVTGEVELLRGTTAGNVYYVMLHADNGGDFDLHDDKPLLSEEGKFVMAMFKAQ